MNENLTRSDFRLLIVEDSEDDALLLLRELKKGGYRPRWTRVDRPDTLNDALAQPWDLAITDHNLPGMDSLEVLHHIQSSQDIPVIVVSGSIGEEVAVETMRRGASDYIMKDN
ncbi:MAG TPA: response regulator, partial [Chromatiales bacterium]|nr:response regulator [Chromatiales bacterium]